MTCPIDTSSSTDADASAGTAPLASDATESEEVGAPPTGWAAVAEVWALAWPTVLTMMSYTVMQFVDRLMVGRVGPLELAAQGNGGIWAFTPISIAIGILTMVNTFVAQNLGAKRLERTAAYAWSGFWISIVMWLVVLLPLAVMIGPIFSLMYDPERVTDLDRLLPMQTAYAQILLAAGVITLFARTISQFFFGLHRPLVVTTATVIGNIVNVVANYVLIFGEEGLPELGLPGVPGVPAMGVVGAAIGTVIGTAVEFLIPFALFLGPKLAAELHTRRTWRPAWKPVRDLLRLGWPNALQYGNELICWALFMTVLVGSFGSVHMTAGWITLGYMHLSFMPAFGFSVAVTSLVGRYIGAGMPEVALHRARLGLAIGLLYMTACAVFFVIFRTPLIELFLPAESTDPETFTAIVRIGGMMLICAAVFQTLDAVGIIYSGALRGAGDTVWPGLVTMVLSWSCIVGGGWLLITYAPNLESLGPWIAASAYIMLLGLVMGLRFESGRWRRIRLIQPDASSGH